MEANERARDTGEPEVSQRGEPQPGLQIGVRLRRLWRENWLFLLVVGGIVAVFLMLRTTASAVGSVQEVDAILTDGTPTLVEFYSNT